MEKQTVSKQKRILSVSFNIIFYLIIAGLLLFSIMTVRSSKAQSIPNVFGKGYIAVSTDSMDADMPDWVPDGSAKPFKANTLIIVSILDDDLRQELKVGDVVTFYDTNLQALNTHRVKVVHKSGDTITKVTTQGDKYQNDDGKTEEVLITHVFAVHKGGRVAGLGWLFIQLQKPVVFAIFIILPVFIVLVIQAIYTFNIMYKMKLAKKTEEEEDLIEARIQAEIEKRLKEQTNKENE